MTRSYLELVEIPTFEERYRYLALNGVVGRSTFGYDRWLNQQFYHSSLWKSIRRAVILRDNGCDLGVDGYDIHSRLYVHHMNPMDVDDIVHGSPDALDPNHLICTTHATHNAIHYGDERQLPTALVPRRPGDTQLWRKVT